MDGKLSKLPDPSLVQSHSHPFIHAHCTQSLFVKCYGRFVPLLVFEIFVSHDMHNSCSTTLRTLQSNRAQFYWSKNISTSVECLSGTDSTFSCATFPSSANKAFPMPIFLASGITKRSSSYMCY